MWDPILEVRAVDNNRQAILDELARLDKLSLLNLMPFETQGGWAEEKWRLARNKLRHLAHISCHRLEDAGGQRELRLTETMKISDQEANTELVGSNTTSSYCFLCRSVWSCW